MKTEILERPVGFTAPEARLFAQVPSDEVMKTAKLMTFLAILTQLAIMTQTLAGTAGTPKLPGEWRS